MIRRSAVIAVIALVISLLVHVGTLEVAVTDTPPASASQDGSDEVATGVAFEDIAETVRAEPIPIPTSRALVASPNPQAVTRPDTGPAEAQQPVTPDTTVSPVSPAPAEPAPEASTAPTPSPPAELAARIPPPATALEPRPPETPNAPTLEPEPDPSGQAVAASPRPPAQRPEQAIDLSAPPTRLIESPLTAYRRDGADLVVQGGGALTASRGFTGGRSGGNAGQTNYAGRVLMQLNQTPLIPGIPRGFAQIFFKINPDGSLASVTVLNSTGTAAFNRAAREQVRKAAPFPPPPNGRTRELSFTFESD